jgi:peptidoglycan-associated lipoprotein
MRVSNAVKAISLAVSVAWMVGCSSPNTVSEEGIGSTDTSANAYGSGNGSDVNGVPAEVAHLQTVFYFDFDAATVRSDSIADLEGHARYLAAHPDTSIRLEGHADERGTREYNMALGERRAKSVERFMAINGVTAGQVEVISYGEEKPAEMGNGEASWSQNRRVELKYVAR